MPSVAFYNQIVKPGMTKVEVSNKAQSDAVSDAVAALNLSLPNGEVVETKLADNAISLAPGEFGKLILSAPTLVFHLLGLALRLLVAWLRLVLPLFLASGLTVMLMALRLPFWMAQRCYLSGAGSTVRLRVVRIAHRATYSCAMVALCLSLVSSQGRWESLTRYSTRDLPEARLTQSAVRLFLVLVLQSLTIT